MRFQIQIYLKNPIYVLRGFQVFFFPRISNLSIMKNTSVHALRYEKLNKKVTSKMT